MSRLFHLKIRCRTWYGPEGGCVVQVRNIPADTCPELVFKHLERFLILGDGVIDWSELTASRPPVFAIGRGVRRAQRKGKR